MGELDPSFFTSEQLNQLNDLRNRQRIPSLADGTTPDPLLISSICESPIPSFARMSTLWKKMNEAAQEHRKLSQGHDVNLLLPPEFTTTEETVVINGRDRLLTHFTRSTNGDVFNTIYLVTPHYEGDHLQGIIVHDLNRGTTLEITNETVDEDVIGLVTGILQRTTRALLAQNNRRKSA